MQWRNRLGEEKEMAEKCAEEDLERAKKRERDVDRRKKLAKYYKVS